MNNFIENVSRADIMMGFHSDPGPNSLLIQISDPGVPHPDPLYKFGKVKQFSFDDTECSTDEWAITDIDAGKIATLLREAIEQHMNVIVHCHAGLCRSGAVAECGIILGLNPPERNRIPNTLVKCKILNALGLAFDPEASPFNYIDFDKF